MCATRSVAVETQISKSQSSLAQALEQHLLALALDARRGRSGTAPSSTTSALRALVSWSQPTVLYRLPSSSAICAENAFGYEIGEYGARGWMLIGVMNRRVSLARLDRQRASRCRSRSSSPCVNASSTQSEKLPGLERDRLAADRDVRFPAAGPARDLDRHAHALASAAGNARAFELEPAAIALHHERHEHAAAGRVLGLLGASRRCRRR